MESFARLIIIIYFRLIGNLLIYLVINFSKCYVIYYCINFLFTHTHIHTHAYRIYIYIYTHRLKKIY